MWLRLVGMLLWWELSRELLLWLGGRLRRSLLLIRCLWCLALFAELCGLLEWTLLESQAECKEDFRLDERKIDGLGVVLYWRRFGLARTSVQFLVHLHQTLNFQHILNAFSSISTCFNCKVVHITWATHQQQQWGLFSLQNILWPPDVYITFVLNKQTQCYHLERSNWTRQQVDILTQTIIPCTACRTLEKICFWSQICRRSRTFFSLPPFCSWCTSTLHKGSGGTFSLAFPPVEQQQNTKQKLSLDALSVALSWSNPKGSKCIPHVPAKLDIETATESKKEEVKPIKGVSVYAIGMETRAGKHRSDRKTMTQKADGKPSLFVAWPLSNVHSTVRCLLHRGREDQPKQNDHLDYHQVLSYPRYHQTIKESIGPKVWYPRKFSLFSSLSLFPASFTSVSMVYRRSLRALLWWKKVERCLPNPLLLWNPR